MEDSRSVIGDWQGSVLDVHSLVAPAGAGAGRCTISTKFEDGYELPLASTQKIRCTGVINTDFGTKFAAQAAAFSIFVSDEEHKIRCTGVANRDLGTNYGPCAAEYVTCATEYDACAAEYNACATE